MFTSFGIYFKSHNFCPPERPNHTGSVAIFCSSHRGCALWKLWQIMDAPTTPCAKVSVADDDDLSMCCFAATWASLSRHIERKPLNLEEEFDTYFPTNQTYNGEALFMGITVMYTRVLKRATTSPKTNKCRNNSSSDCDSSTSEKSDIGDAKYSNCKQLSKRGRLSYYSS